MIKSSSSEEVGRGRFLDLNLFEEVLSKEVSDFGLGSPQRGFGGKVSSSSSTSPPSITTSTSKKTSDSSSDDIASVDIDGLFWGEGVSLPISFSLWKGGGVDNLLRL